MKSFDSDWHLKLGEVEINFNNETYIMAAGYITNESFKDKLYVRLWKNERLIFGTGFSSVKYWQHEPSSIDSSFISNAPPGVIEICIVQAERLEKLKAFA